MNNERRKSLGKIADELEELRTRTEALYDEEQEAFDNMPESLQDGERGQLSQEAISNIENVMSALDDALDAINSAQEV